MAHCKLLVVILGKGRLLHRLTIDYRELADRCYIALLVSLCPNHLIEVATRCCVPLTIGDNDYLALQAFGLVDCHNLYCIIAHLYTQSLTLASLVPPVEVVANIGNARCRKGDNLLVDSLKIGDTLPLLVEAEVRYYAL